MTRGLIFWVIMVLLLIFGGLFFFGTLGMFGAPAVGVVAYILFALLGWQVFGPVIRG